MTKSMGKHRAWTEEDMATARRLYKELKTYKAVAVAMGRSPTTVQEWLQGLRGKARVKRFEIENGMIVVPHERLEDRDQRLSTPYSDVTGYLMGDPRPGYSAFDKATTRAETRAG